MRSYRRREEPEKITRYAGRFGPRCGNGTGSWARDRTRSTRAAATSRGTRHRMEFCGRQPATCANGRYTRKTSR